MEYTVILASGSPRRRAYMQGLFDRFTVRTAPVDETLPEGMHPREGVEVLAVRKGAPVAAENPGAVVVSSDTLVEIDGEALGKPRNAADAAAMLRALSGRTHRVHTGVAVQYGGRVYSGVATTAVRFHTLTEPQIAAYIATGEPMDKAGSYGIQGAGGALVAGIDGDYDTVVGLSRRLLCRLLREAVPDIDIHEYTPEEYLR